jgi:phosphoglycolate phosphatase
MKPQILVLFDIDGTLLLSSGCGRVATGLAMLEVFGTSGNLAGYRFQGKTDWYTLLELLQPEGFSQADIEATLPYYETVVARHMTEIVDQYRVYALPGALELLDELDAHPGIVLGIVTGNLPRMAEIKLRRAGFALGKFPVTAYGSEAPIRRQLVPLALERAERYAGQRFAPSDVVFVGDTPDDIDCAHSIGARAIAVTTGMTSRAELEQHPPVHVVDSLADRETVLPLILGKLS